MPTRSESPDARPMKVIGKRRSHVGDGPPTREAREAMATMALYKTRAPKGIFIYRSHDEANADHERWIVDAVVVRAQARRDG